jgi:hypothetical protein
MTKENDRNGPAEEQRSRPKAEGSQCCGHDFEKSEFAAGDMKKMMQACPCGEMLKRHRVAIYTALIGLGLAVAVLPIGWILGVIAFFRTI